MKSGSKDRHSYRDLKPSSRRLETVGPRRSVRQSGAKGVRVFGDIGSTDLASLQGQKDWFETDYIFNYGFFL